MDGLLVIDKPAGPTSHDVVARVRRLLDEPRIGHTGTLDPAASGVLPLVLGRATRLARFLSGSVKRYEAVVRFGQATDTYDAEGQPVGPRASVSLPPRERIESALDAFRGTFEQQPPAFSAKKIAGRRSYKSARAARQASGRSAPPDADALPAAPALPAPVRVTVYRLEILDIADDAVSLGLECSAGFYVRSLAHELGGRLGIGAHLAALRRTASGGATLADAVALDAAERNRTDVLAAIVPLDRMLAGLPSVVLNAGGLERAIHGRDVGSADIARGIWTDGGPVRLFDQGGHLVGIGELGRIPGILHPSVVLR